VLLVDDLLLSPMNGLLWLFREVHDIVKAERDGEGEAITKSLSELYQRLESGAITEEQFNDEEARLLDRLDAIEARDDADHAAASTDDDDVDEEEDGDDRDDDEDDDEDDDDDEDEDEDDDDDDDEDEDEDEDDEEEDDEDEDDEDDEDEDEDEDEDDRRADDAAGDVDVDGGPRDENPRSKRTP